MRALLLIPALLVGCAATQRDPTAVSNWEICEYTMGGGNNAMVAQNEARRRGLDCAPYYPAIAAKRSSDAAAMNQAAQYFLAPRGPALPRTINCQSYRVGDRVDTDCR